MRRVTGIVGLLVILAVTQNTAGFPRKSKRSIDMRDIDEVDRISVPRVVIPTSYDLELRPFVGNNKFEGRVKINATVMETTDTITLRVDPELRISSYHIRVIETPKKLETGGPYMDVNVARVKTPETRKPWYIMDLEQMLSPNSECEIDLTFTGNLTTQDTSGFLKTEYMDSDGRKHYYVMTYLRMIHPQKLFPCIDLLRHKAVFKLRVLRPKNMTALSNTPIESSIEEPEQPNMMWDHFEKTPPMNPFQLALVVSDLESISPKTEINEINGKKLDIKVWGRKEYMETLKDVPDKIVKIMNYLQDYFNASIVLPKLDIMALPMYSAVKTSDSWGLMCFKETELSSPLYWMITNELISQWIGQSVTPGHLVDLVMMKPFNSFLTSMTTLDLNPDEMEGKWPMTLLYSLYYEFGKTVPFSRVQGIRDETRLAKRELLFRMFNYTLGRELFRVGVRQFIQNQAESDDQPGSTNEREFFIFDAVYQFLSKPAYVDNALPKHLTVASIAEKWVNRDRIPLLTVNRDYETKAITFSQKVYLREPAPVEKPIQNYRWEIPIMMLTQDKLQFSDIKRVAWMTEARENSGNLTIPDITDENNFIIVNPEEIGMFPVNYDSGNWQMLANFLQGPNRESIPVLTRAKLLHDAWNLAYAGELCFVIALNMTLFLKEERNHVVWQPVFTMIDHIGRRLEGSQTYMKFEAYTRYLLKPLYLELGETPQPGEPSWKVHMRGYAKNFLCRAGYEPCVKEAREQYYKWMDDEEPDKGNPVANEFLCPVFKWGTNREWQFGLDRVINFPQYSPGRKQNERTYLLKTLAGCPIEPAKIDRLLTVAFLMNENFTDSDIRLIVNTLTGRAAGYTTLLRFLVQHWNTIKSQYEDKEHLWNTIVNSATSSFNDQEGLDRVNKLYAERQGQSKSTDRILKKAIETIKNEMEWNKKNRVIIDMWLNENVPGEEFGVSTTTDCKCHETTQM